MKFLGSRMEEGTVGEEQSPLQSILIVAALAYLAVPNILFLWGWFVPWVAVLMTLLIAFAVVRAGVLSLGKGFSLPRVPWSRWILFALGCLVAFLVSFNFLFRVGLLGFLPSYCDLDVLRNAMFANLRDAAWPLVLPNGKEMSYYLAGVLPPALMARLLPGCGQWPVVIWTALAMLLCLFLMSSTLRMGRLAWGWRLVMVSAFMAVVCSPFASIDFQYMARLVLHRLDEWAGIGLPSLVPSRLVVCGNCLSGCGGVYNSFAPALLVASLLVACRRRQEVVLPVALSLLVPLSPFGGVGLLPLVLVRCLQGLRARKPRLLSLIPDAILPVCMAFLCAVYFTRPDGESAVSLSFIAWGWLPFLHHYLWLSLGWVTLLLPLWVVVRRDGFLYAISACCFLLPFIFIGTMPEAGKGANNELWLKSTSCYMLLVGYYWLAAWRHIGWYRYLFLGACVTFALLTEWSYFRNWGSNAYLQVDDQWNGHLNHDAEFLNQSVPVCKPPLVPGIMLHEGGASERSFPGSLLPKSPGCDYSRPARGEAQELTSPL